MIVAIVKTENGAILASTGATPTKLVDIPDEVLEILNTETYPTLQADDFIVKGPIFKEDCNKSLPPNKYGEYLMDKKKGKRKYKNS